MRRSHADSSISVPRRADVAGVDDVGVADAAQRPCGRGLGGRAVEAKTDGSAPSVAGWNMRSAFIRWRMACIIGSATWTTAVSVPKRASLRRHAASP